MLADNETPGSALLRGRTVIVTGGGRGIGRDIAMAMAAAGAQVVVNDIGATVAGEGHDDGPAHSVVEEIRAAGGNAVADTNSVASWESALRIVQTAMQSFGRIDALVNNAGILRDRFFHKMDPAEWRAVMDVNLDGVFYISRAVAPVFRQQEGGCYVNLTSTSGLIGNIGQANYGAAKAGVAALSRTMAKDMERFNVRSNCIAPFAYSRMVDAIPTDRPEMAAKVEKAKKMETRKVAPLAVYLASDLASDVTGQVFCVRANELFLMSQPRPLRSVHRSQGWTPESIAEHAMPAFRSQFYDLDVSADVFTWDPI